MLKELAHRFDVVLNMSVAVKLVGFGSFRSTDSFFLENAKVLLKEA
jgi:hypothetical protein